MNISMKSIISAISLALDLSDSNWNKLDSLIDPYSGVNYCLHVFSNHCKRTTYIALELGRQLNLAKDTYYNLYITSLIHDIGTQNIFDMAHNSVKYMRKHCEEGYDMLKDIPSFSHIAKIIKYHHENYDGSGCFNLSNNEIPLESEIIKLADSIDILVDYTKHYYTNMDFITNWVEKKKDSLFSPKLVDAFFNISKKETFWLNLYNQNLIDNFLAELAPKHDTYISLEEFEKLANLFASIIDKKSSFTGSHSKDIADLAYRISLHLNYDSTKAMKMKIAGLLHDIGKIAIPHEILEKASSLDDEEFALIKSHVYYTRLILSQIENIEDICAWACNHHEKLNGDGYPNRLTADDLSEEARIIAVCDIYQALVEDRPYRKGLSNEESFEIMNNMVNQEIICKKALDSLKAMIFNIDVNNIATTLK